MTSLTEETRINFFSCCTITRGHNRSIIVDFQRKNYWFITTVWATFFAEHRSTTLNEIRTELGDFLSAEAIDNFVQFLIDHEIVFLSAPEIAGQFPLLSTTWKTPGTIHIASVDTINENPLLTTEHITTLQVNYLILYCAGQFNLDALLSYYETSRLKGIELFFSESFPVNCLPEEFLNNHPHVHRIYIMGNNPTQTVQHKNGTIHYSNADSPLATHRFAIDLELYNESQHYHTYFNRRMHICANGDLKNTRETIDIHGNILEETPLHKLVTQPKFKKLWYAKKDRFDVCQHCEFRHICADRRIPKKRNNGQWYTEEECTYNPYISAEKGEEHYLTLRECGVKSNAQGFNIDVFRYIGTKERIWH